VSRPARARIGYFLGLLAVAAGLGWFVHPGLGVAVAGVGLIAWSVLLYDVDEPNPIDPDEEVRLR
jgi:hypothetical protein